MAQHLGDMYELLSRPFELDEHAFRDGDDSGKPYIKRSAILKRLSQVDPGWKFYVNPAIQVINDTVTTWGTLTIRGVSRDNASSVGILLYRYDRDTRAKVPIDPSEVASATERAIESATSSLFQRVAQSFGVGIYPKEPPFKGVKNMAQLAEVLRKELHWTAGCEGKIFAGVAKHLGVNWDTLKVELEPGIILTRLSDVTLTKEAAYARLSELARLPSAE